MSIAPLRKRIGHVLRQRREATGLSQESFAPLAGMHRTYYSNIERGIKDMQIQTLEKVCKALHVPLWAILKDAEEHL